jgi:uncharacterized protein YdhG (YjbR/CyaY superfamily)
MRRNEKRAIRAGQMKKTSATSVESYIAAQPKERRAALERVRRIIRRAIPGAEEGISYQIPAYKLQGRAVIYFAGWKEHYSLYPVTADVVEELGGRLREIEIKKSTIRFPFDEPVPARLIARIAKFRAGEEGKPQKARAASKKSKSSRKSK